MKFKRYVCVLFACIFSASAFIFNANALKIDGVLDESNWKTAEKYSLVTSSAVSNCDVKLGVVSVFNEGKTSRINFGFKVKLSENIGESRLYGVAISINSSEFIYITADSVSSYNTDLFGVEYAIDVTGADSFNAEVAIGMKYGLDSLDDIRVRFVDVSGSPSTVFELEYTPSLSSADEEPTTLPIYINDTQPKETTKRIEKTTKQKITKTKSTKAKSTKLRSDKTDYTVTVSTAWYEYTTDENFTTQLNMKQMKFYDGAFKSLVIVILILMLGVCVSINVIRQNKKNNY